VFDRFQGLPAHPLIVHAAVLFIPLLALGAIAYAVVPGLRRHFRIVVGLLALAAPAAVIAAVLSGNTFRNNKNLQSAQLQPDIDTHHNFGTTTMWLTIGLAVAALLVVFLIAPARRARSYRGNDATLPAPSRTAPIALQVVLGIITVGLAGVTLYYVFRTGDTGAHMVWTGY
jgi:glucan phosphoethanolaminetransferase (alkaline phosphatase superfamily)